MQFARVFEVKNFVFNSLLVLVHLLLASGLLAVVCVAAAQTPAGQGTDTKPNSEPAAVPVRIVPFRDQSTAPSSGQQLAPGSHVTYFGGPVISNVHVVEVLYGGSGYLAGISSTTPPSVASFSTGITASPLFDMLTEYNTAGVTASDGNPGTNQTIGHGVFDGLFTINPSAANNGTTITDGQIEAELLAQVSASNLPAPMLDAQGNPNTVYVIFFPPGKTIRLGTLTSCVHGGFCGYHSTTLGQVGGKNLLYSVLPDMQPPSGCSSGCGGIGQLDSVTNVLSHELSEAVTDPDVGLASSAARPLAWVQATDGQEVGDLCNGQQAIVFFNSQSYTIQKIFSNSQGDCEVGPPTFNIQGGLTVSPGQQFDLPVTAETNSGGIISSYTGTVHFTSSDPAATLPADYTFTAADAGFHTFVVSLGTPTAVGGVQSITATDTSFSLFTGTANYTVPKSAVSHFSVAMPGTAVVGTSVPVIVVARDSSPQNNIVTNYTGTVHFTNTDSTATPLPDSTLTNGLGQFAVTFNKTGLQTVSVTDKADSSIFGNHGSNVIASPASPTATTVGANPNPSTFGQTVTYKATVTQSGNPVTTGSVTFSADGQFLTLIALDSNGNAQVTETFPGGPHTIFADYFASSTPPPSSSAPLSVQVNPAPTTVAVSSTASPSVLGSKIFVIGTLFSANFTPDGGLVTFTDGSTPLAVISPIAGVASFGDTSLTVGSHTITATYSGSVNFAGSTSAPFVQVVTLPPPADYTLQSDKNSATLKAGQSATFTITTNSINGFNGTISFSCGNLPQFTTCTFVPTSTSVSPSNTTATATLAVKTTGPNALLQGPQHRSSEPNVVLARIWVLSPLGFGLFLLTAAQRNKRRQLVLGGLLTLLLLTALTSCGGGGSTPPPPPPPQTPSGATTITVSAVGTASGGSSQPANPNQKLNISITVQ